MLSTVLGQIDTNIFSSEYIATCKVSDTLHGTKYWRQSSHEIRNQALYTMSFSSIMDQLSRRKR